MSMADRDGLIWFDGEMVPWRDARVHVLTHTLHYGMGVFEGVRAYETVKGPGIFRLKEHTDRLFRSAHIMNMAIPYSKEELNAAQLACVRENNLPHAYLRPMVFYGSEGMGLRAENLQVHVIVAAWEWPSYMTPEALEQGIKVRTSSYTRHHVNISMCKAKILRVKYEQVPLSEKPANPWQPKNWPTWAMSGLMYALSRPGLKQRTAIGKALGTVSFYIAKERRRIAKKNIEACFPELPREQRKKLIKKTLIENTVGIVETAAAWWRSPQDFLPYTEFYGSENLLNPLKEGHGVLLIGGHYTTLDMGGALLSLVTDYDVTYRANNDPVMDWVIRKGREHFTDHQIERSEVRQIFKALRSGRVLWYAPDQDYGSKRSVFAPFFSIPTATVKATSKFAAQPNTKVLFISHYRKKDDSGYAVFFSPALENFPTGDETEDARIVNQHLEQEIRRVPEQYMWVHRRFKTRPKGEKPFYK